MLQESQPTGGKRMRKAGSLAEAMGETHSLPSENLTWGPGDLAQCWNPCLAYEVLGLIISTKNKEKQNREGWRKEQRTEGNRTELC